MTASRCKAVCLAAFFIFLCLSGILRAEYYEAGATIAWRQEYDDNGDGEAGFRTVVGTGVDVTRRSERLTAGISGRFDIRPNSENKPDDGEDYDLLGSAGFLLSEKSSLDASAGFSRDSGTDREIEETGLLLRDATRKRINFGLGGSRQLSEILSASLSYGYQEDDYEDRDGTDQQSHNAGLGLSRSISEWMPLASLNTNLGFSRDRFQTSTSDTWRWTAGVSRPLTELTRMDLGAGIRYSQTRQEFFGVSSSRGVWGPVFNASLTHNREFTGLGLSFVWDAKPSSAEGQLVDRKSLSGFVNHRFDEEVTGRLTVRLIRNESFKGTFFTGDVDELSFQVHPNLTVGLSRNWDFLLGYRYLLQIDQVGDTEEPENMLYFQVRCRFSDKDL